MSARLDATQMRPRFRIMGRDTRLAHLLGLVRDKDHCDRERALRIARSHSCYAETTPPPALNSVSEHESHCQGAAVFPACLPSKQRSLCPQGVYLVVGKTDEKTSGENTETEPRGRCGWIRSLPGGSRNAQLREGRSPEGTLSHGTTSLGKDRQRF